MSILNRSLAIGVAAAAIAFAGGSAQATDTTVGLTSGGGSYSGGFTDHVSGSFMDAITFTIPAPGASDGSFTLSSSVTASNVITNLSAYLDNSSQAFVFTTANGPHGSFTYNSSLFTDALAAGAHTIFLSGSTANASISGTISLDAATAAVPETATWAMMIGGIGFVGGAMRRRAVRTSVSFA